MASNNENEPKGATALWIALVANFVGLLFAYSAASDLYWLNVTLSVTLLALVAATALRYKKAFTGRAAAFGLQSTITFLLVLGLLGVLNFLSNAHPLKWDMTKNKLHTLSDDTVKLIKGLKQPVKMVHWGRGQMKEEAKQVLEKYKSLNPSKIETEYVDIDRDIFRAQQAGIKKLGEIQLLYGKKEQKIDELTEEKITNTLVKMTRDKTQTVCFTNGHGEKPFDGREANGLEVVNQGLKNLAYETKAINLVQDAKSVPTCDAVVIAGPMSAFFEPEIKTLEDYLNGGGRVAAMVDLNPKGGEFAPELNALLAKWYVKALPDLAVDIFGQQLKGDAMMVRMLKFNHDSPISKDLIGEVYLPLMRPLEVIPGAPSSLKVEMLAETDKSAWGIADLKTLAAGVLSKQKGDKDGPLNGAMTVDGKQKDSKAPRNTRIVVFGSSMFATNQFSRAGVNVDLVLNSISWLVEDESMISIHAKDEGPGKVDLSPRTAGVVKLLTVFLIPFFVMLAGITIWVRRRKL